MFPLLLPRPPPLSRSQKFLETLLERCAVDILGCLGSIIEGNSQLFRYISRDILSRECGPLEPTLFSQLNGLRYSQILLKGLHFELSCELALTAPAFAHAPTRTNTPTATPIPTPTPAPPTKNVINLSRSLQVLARCFEIGQQTTNTPTLLLDVHPSLTLVLCDEVSLVALCRNALDTALKLNRGVGTKRLIEGCCSQFHSITLVVRPQESDIGHRKLRFDALRMLEIEVYCSVLRGLQAMPVNYRNKDAAALDALFSPSFGQLMSKKLALRMHPSAVFEVAQSASPYNLPPSLTRSPYFHSPPHPPDSQSLGGGREPLVSNGRTELRLQRFSFPYWLHPASTSAASKFCGVLLAASPIELQKGGRGIFNTVNAWLGACDDDFSEQRGAGSGIGLGSGSWSGSGPGMRNQNAPSHDLCVLVVSSRRASGQADSAFSPSFWGRDRVSGASTPHDASNVDRVTGVRSRKGSRGSREGREGREGGKGRTEGHKRNPNPTSRSPYANLEEKDASSEGKGMSGAMAADDAAERLGFGLGVEMGLGLGLG